MGGVGTMYPEDAFQHQVMEEEFDLQLHLLQEETPDPTLFPEVEDKMAELPHLKDGTVEDQSMHKMLKIPKHLLHGSAYGGRCFGIFSILCIDWSCCVCPTTHWRLDLRESTYYDL